MLIAIEVGGGGAGGAIWKATPRRKSGFALAVVHGGAGPCAGRGLGDSASSIVLTSVNRHSTPRPRRRICQAVPGLVLADPVLRALPAADAPRPGHTVVTRGPRRSTAARATQPEGGRSPVSSRSGLHFVICVWRGVLHGHQKGPVAP